MDRRFVLAIVLMMVVLIVPSLIWKPKRPLLPDSSVVTTPVPPRAAEAAPAAGLVRAPVDTGAAGPGDTVRVSSSLYQFGFSTRGGRLIEAMLPHYQSLNPTERGQPVQLLSPDSRLLQLSLLVGRDTLHLSDWRFTPSAPSLTVTQPSTLTMSAMRDSVGVELSYTFAPNDFRIGVAGRVTGAGPNGATLLVGMGPGLRNTESDSVGFGRESGLVTKDTKSTLKRFMELKVGEPIAINGPFEWVAVKSKYFVTALLAFDSTQAGVGRIGGVTAVTTDVAHKRPESANVTTSLSVPATGRFDFMLYVGPMEHPRLREIGHDFDDINPYGWPGFRTIIRPVAEGARWLLVWFHDRLGLAWGLGLILFGVLIRVVLWPLNQKAMRASMQMQAVQPILKGIQEKYKSDPQRLQQEMFKVYKEYKVNPFSGCWPMLLPWPVLLALYFVFANTIELRGASFLWLPDLSRPDPIYIIPVLMGLSMFAVTRLGQRGLPPNPQMKAMLYIMPAMMTVLFLTFPSGLNLYYTVMNLASIPQQWMISQERLRKIGPTAAR
ncbi:MAG: membrane protein insertase YidC [Gemmatimonadota bacterium]